MEFLLRIRPHFSYGCIRPIDQCLPLLGYVSPVGTIEAQGRVQVGFGVDADDRSCVAALRVEVDVGRLEAAARFFGVAFDDDGLVVLQVGEADVVPAGLSNTALARALSKPNRM